MAISMTYMYVCTRNWVEIEYVRNTQYERLTTSDDADVLSRVQTHDGIMTECEDVSRVHHHYALVVESSDLSKLNSTQLRSRAKFLGKQTRHPEHFFFLPKD